jgi:hypothetical protein
MAPEFPPIDLLPANPCDGNGSTRLAAANLLSDGCPVWPGGHRDFNGDGKLDLAILNADNSISIFLGNGDGTFGAKTNSGTLSDGGAIFVGDLNADGKLDLVS